MKKLNIAGERFNRWEALEVVNNTKIKTYWLCRCDCGKEKEIALTSLTSGLSRSCGCLRKEQMTTHGLTKSPEYTTWLSMNQRCTNKKDPNYKSYGGRGVTVCDRWGKSFECFLEDMGARKKGMTLDRINNDGNYEPKNCRWADKKTQGNNRRSNHCLTINGQKLTITEWSRQLSLSRSTIQHRLRAGWKNEDVIIKANKYIRK